MSTVRAADIAHLGRIEDDDEDDLSGQQPTDGNGASDPSSPDSPQSPAANTGGAKTIKQQQTNQATFMVLFLFFFFVGISALIKAGNGDVLYHFNDNGTCISMTSDQLCTQTNNSCVRAIGGTPSCQFLREIKTECGTVKDRLHAANTMINVLFGTFLMINAVAGAVAAVAFLRALLTRTNVNAPRIRRLLNKANKLFAPALLGAICFIPFAVITGVAAAAVIASLALDTLCPDKPGSMFVRPMANRVGFRFGLGAILIMIGLVAGFAVLVIGIVIVVRSRDKLANLHNLKQRQRPSSVGPAAGQATLSGDLEAGLAAHAEPIV